MGRLDGLFDPESSKVVLYAGKIVGDPESVLDQLEVIIPAFDHVSTHGPAPWPTRVDDDGLLLLPQDGDRCVVAVAETDRPGEPEVWIIGWWPGGS